VSSTYAIGLSSTGTGARGLPAPGQGPVQVYIFQSVSASLSFMDPLFLIIMYTFLYLCFFGWSVWKRIDFVTPSRCNLH
jgi:hypothetical protein